MTYIPLSEIKPSANAPKMTCIKCRFADPLPETNFEIFLDNPDAKTVVYCAKVDRIREAHITTSCTIASVKRATKGKFESRAPIRSKVRCDRRVSYTAMEVKLLKQLWGKNCFQFLVDSCLRSSISLRNKAYSLGLERLAYDGREKSSGVKQSRSKRENGLALNDAQREQIKKLYNSDRWPRRGGSNKPEALKERYRKQKSVARSVSILGREVTWKTCYHFVYLNSPARVLRKKKNAKS